jgi:hypothetical protein
MVFLLLRLIQKKTKAASPTNSETAALAVARPRGQFHIRIQRAGGDNH